MSVDLLNRFLSCPTCAKNQWSDADLDRQRPLSPEGHITCTACQSQLPVVSGVIIAEPSHFDLELGSDESDSKAVYSEYWDLASEQYDSEGYGSEQDVIQKFSHHIENRILLDAGCGDGRHIPSWNALGVGTLICLDLSDGIFLARKRQIALGSQIPSLFILGSLLAIPLKPKCVETLWCSGTLNLIHEQHSAITNMVRVTQRSVLLGLTSNNALGRLYQRLNIIRPLCRGLFRMGLFTPITWLLAGLLYSYCALSVRLGRALPPFTLDSAKRISSQIQGVQKLQKVLNEPFISPNIQRLPDETYMAHFEDHQFSGQLLTSDFLIDYFQFLPRTAARK